MAEREAVQHADSDAGRRNSGLNLDPKTQTHVWVRVRVTDRVSVRRILNGDRTR